MTPVPERRVAPRYAGRLGVGALIVATGFGLVGTGVSKLTPASRDVGTIPTVATVPPPPGTVPPASARSQTARPEDLAVPFVPLRIGVPGRALEATVLPVGVERGGQVAVPSDAGTVGWWSGGALPGVGSGTVVLVGHVDAAGGLEGALYMARRWQPGDRIVLGGAGGRSASYSVVARRQYDKNDLPARDVFGQGAAPRLVLVTCGGPFDAATRHYRDNLVVYAVPSGD